MQPATLLGAVRDPRFMPRLAAALAALLTVAWAAYLYVFMPSVSRGDFLLAILRVSAAAREGDWAYALSWPLHVLGGHIVFYERALQLFNYYVLGYSPWFVKICAIAAWMLVGRGLYALVRRSEPAGPAQVVLLVGLVLVSFNPIPWDVLAWPDANIPYLSSLIALLFAGPAIVRLLQAPLDRPATGRLVLLSFLVIIGSGVGWSIVPAIVYLHVVNAVSAGNFRRIRLIAGAVAVFLVAIYAVIYLFAETLRMGLVAESLSNLDFTQLGSYFLALQATLFGIDARPLSVWAGGGLLLAAFAIYVAYKRRHPGATEAELLFVFGLVSLMLVSLGRWKLNMERPGATLPTYYHIFALPYFYGLLLMLARLLPRRGAPWVLAAVFAGVVLSVAQRLDFYHRNFRGQGDSYAQMLPAVQGWRMTEAIRLIGEAFFNQQIFLEFLPALQQAGKYRSLAADFHPYRSSRIAPPQPTANGNACNPGYRDLHVLEVSRDTRAPYTQGYAELPFHRFVGVARNDRSCQDNHVLVSLVAADGTVSCRSRTTINVYWHYQSAGHEDILRSPYAFDFSCPVETPGPFYLVSTERDTGRVIATVPVLPKSTPEPRP